MYVSKNLSMSDEKVRTGGRFYRISSLTASKVMKVELIVINHQLA